MEKPIVLSLGGSLIAPKDIDARFLRQFIALIRAYAKRGCRFAIICGGGMTARKYQQAAKKIARLDNEALDWVGIEATRLNAFLLMKLFGGDAEEAIIYDPSRPFRFKKGIVVASGWKPGRSTDYDAVLIAKRLKADTIINMSNIDHVYSADPKTHRNARPLHSLSWKEYRRMAGNTWIAGLSLPFDPIAAKEAQASGMSVRIIGKDLKNFRDILNGGKWEGTVIS